MSARVHGKEHVMGITVRCDTPLNTTVAEAIDEEMAEFNEFARTRLGEALAKPEAAIVKTYIAWKLGLDRAPLSSETQEPG
jgi:hypothetical protein